MGHYIVCQEKLYEILNKQSLFVIFHKMLLKYYSMLLYVYEQIMKYKSVIIKSYNGNQIVGVSLLQMDSPPCDIYRLSSLLISLGEAVTKNGNIRECVKLRRGFSLLSFIHVLFSFNIFLITHFRVMLSFEPPLDHNTNI